MLKFYQWLMNAGEPLLLRLLDKRVQVGKEDPVRLCERQGIASRPRPDTKLYWLHAASVGEAQSALILVKSLLEQERDLQILITTGTVTSAQMMDKKLPENAFHQYYPLDNPKWVHRFLDHWRPDLVLWMESELWPNMLGEIRKRNIPAALINARLSERSFKRWTIAAKSAATLLSTFDNILCQTDKDAAFYTKLGAKTVAVTDNIKFNASPLPFDEKELARFESRLLSRPRWVYASTHQGEEIIAAHTHLQLKKNHPDLLTIIIPRHPNRREEIKIALRAYGVKAVFRSDEEGYMPDEDTEIYIADTLGELGLFYRLCPIAMIGRSLSNDGGGGHNPIEAAQLNCAILHGENVQNLQDIFDEMDGSGAALGVQNEAQLTNRIDHYLANPEALEMAQNAALTFAKSKKQVLPRVLQALAPLIEDTNIKPAKAS